MYPVYNFRKFYKMHSVCNCCGQNYKIEPGFYLGAMYFSYAFVVATVILEGVLIYFTLNDPAVWIYTTVIMSSVVLFTPVFFRYSRILFLHLFGGISFDPSLNLKNC